MKKISLFAIAALVAGMTFTSCKDDTQPRLEKPTEFVLNTPQMADQTYIVDEGSSITFSCSQANYGLGTTPTYQLEVSKTEDFSNPVAVDYTTTQAQMTIPAEAFSMAVCSAFEWDAPEKVTTVPVYVRCKSIIPNASEEYTITSNVVTLKNVQVYFAVKLPDVIYLIGQPQGWDVNNLTMPLTETEIGSRIYMGEYDIAAGEFQFRFYDEFNPASPWDWYSIGSQDDDNPVEISFTDGEYAGKCFYDPATEKAGKGSWQVPDWAGGKVEMTVNLNDKTVVFKAL